MRSKATSVADYLGELPPDRREIIEAVRSVIRKNLDAGFEEGMQYGMIAYYVPHRLYPPGYHCDPNQPLTFAGLASQKNHLALYLMCVYGSPDHERWFREAWAKTGKKLDLVKSCLRFKKVEDLALDVVGAAIGRVTARGYIEHYQAARAQAAAAKATRRVGKAETKSATRGRGPGAGVTRPKSVPPSPRPRSEPGQ